MCSIFRAWGAILLSIASIAARLGALRCCSASSPIGQSTTGLMLVLFVILVAFMSWGYTQLFTGRAALLHMGAFTATIMAANVAMIIIPNQKIVVGDLKAGRKPDAKYGKIAKQRSLHNNYLTLPVIFFMLSNHYPLAFATQWNWIIASLIFLVGVSSGTISTPATRGRAIRTGPGAVPAILFILIVAIDGAEGADRVSRTETSARRRASASWRPAHFEPRRA
jgi:uncharacterized membrane protein